MLNDDDDDDNDDDDDADDADDMIVKRYGDGTVYLSNIAVLYHFIVYNYIFIHNLTHIMYM